MNISTAAIYAQQGCQIRRASWVVPYHFDTIGLSFTEGGLVVNDKVYFVFTADDLLADDWEIVPQWERPLLTIQEPKKSNE